MGSVTCDRCGFVSFATSEICKQCGTPLAAAHTGARPPQGQAAPSPYTQASFAGQRGKGIAAAALVCGLVGIPAFVLAVLIGWALGVSPAAAGLLGFVLFCVSSLLGITLGIAAAVKANKQPAVFGGKGLAVAGIVLGALSLISVVPIGLVSAIAIPNLLAARRAANEGMALSSIREIVVAQQDYSDRIEEGQSGTLDELFDAQLIDDRRLGDRDRGYRIEVEADGDSYVVTAVPVSYPDTGKRSFYYYSREGIVHGGDKGGRAANEDDPVIFNSEGRSEGRNR